MWPHMGNQSSGDCFIGMGFKNLKVLCYSTDKSRDISVREEIIVVLCYVDMKEYVIECFIGSIHVKSTIL
uniref:Uncharacterized protein n=1 Tax=Salix viminalis TaxID=40686 RepID=A0A6N2N9T8_SALVM